jgi:NADH:ubiquinone oxidoreductase subunit 5 (subunit L)/multisubunit Na+/H+ antiporter MnhA subunit
VVTLPLVLLAIPSVLIGFFTIEPMLFGDWFKGVIFVGDNHVGLMELAANFHGASAWRSMACRPRRSGWRWVASRSPGSST